MLTSVLKRVRASRPTLRAWLHIYIYIYIYISVCLSIYLIIYLSIDLARLAASHFAGVRARGVGPLFCCSCLLGFRYHLFVFSDFRLSIHYHYYYYHYYDGVGTLYCMAADTVDRDVLHYDVGRHQQTLELYVKSTRE